MKDRTEGALFTIDNAHKLEKISGIVDARNYLIEIVDNHPTAKNSVKEQTKRDIWNSMTVKKLMFLVSNYVLAHQNDNLKVIR